MLARGDRLLQRKFQDPAGACRTHHNACGLQAPTGAMGFRAAATKWLVLVRLLLGEIPGHLEFVQPGLQQRLQPYYELTQAVRVGDLSQFS